MNAKLINVTLENVETHGCFCLKGKKKEGYTKKINWLKKRFKEGLKLKILHSETEGQIGFIEYISGEFSWRGFSDKDYMFIHCIYIARKKDRGCGNGKLLIDACIQDANKANKKGVAMITSGKSMLAEKDIFLKNGFVVADTAAPNYQLMIKQLEKGKLPKLERSKVSFIAIKKGFHLIYANQCPYFYNSVNAIQRVCSEYGLALKTSELTNAKDAQGAPSLYGVFNLLYNGELVVEHYISETRFRNILEKELKLKK